MALRFRSPETTWRSRRRRWGFGRERSLHGSHGDGRIEAQPSSGVAPDPDCAEITSVVVNGGAAHSQELRELLRVHQSARWATRLQALGDEIGKPFELTVIEGG